MKKEIEFISRKKDKIKLLDEQISVGQTRIEMLSNKEIIVDGCGGVLEFSDTYIKLKLKKGNIIVYGKELLINGFEEETITISGNLSSVEFCIREQGKNV